MLNNAVASQFVAHARHSLVRHHLPRVARCLETLSDRQVWWRPHRTSNSIGNLVLHLEGNVRQWILSGLGGQPDRRQRDLEFVERGPIPRLALLDHLRRTVIAAGRVISKMSPRDLRRPRLIQGFRVTGLKAVAHVTEHFAYHTGQIIYSTKLQKRADLKFTRLPADRGRKRERKLPAI